MSDGMGSQIAAGWRNMSAETRKKTATYNFNFIIIAPFKIF